MNILDELAKKYGTDKSSNWHNYTKFYSEILFPRREYIRGVVEIGIGKPNQKDQNTWGASLKMWRDYFPHAHIVGIDRVSDLAIDYGQNISVIISDQTDEEKLLQINNILENVDIIIDDCSHINKFSIKTFHILFKILKPGGIYFIEDTVCSNHKNLGNSRQEYETFIVELMRDIETNSKNISKNTCADFDKIYDKSSLSYYERWVERVDIVRGIYAIYKREE